MKRSLAILAAYLLLSAGVLGGFLGGVFWLLQSEPTMAREQRPAPIPPRIAESIERKLVPPPPVVKQPEPIKQAMQEAEVALTQTPRKVQIRDLAPRPVQRKPRQDERALASRAAPVSQEFSASAQAVSTARSDSPY